MGQDVKNASRFCQIPAGLGTRRLSTNTDRREIIVAAGLITVLSIAALSTYLLWAPPPFEESPIASAYAVISIDGDANFTATALLEGWPGDGSPENPYIIDGLDIERDQSLGIDGEGHCILIENTRVSFIIRYCNLTGASCHMIGIEYAGITLVNVSGGLLVNNVFHQNEAGIYLADSRSNTVVNNTFHDNFWGICLADSLSNTVVNNTFYACMHYGGIGIDLESSHLNNIVNNTCNVSSVGIGVDGSGPNTLVNNTCSNAEIGIRLSDSDSNIVANNNCFNNTEHGIYLLFSENNTLSDNTFNSNDIGIYLRNSDSNTLANNNCSNNRIDIYKREVTYERIILGDGFDSGVLLSIGFVGFIEFLAITLLAGLIVGKRVSMVE